MNEPYEGEGKKKPLENSEHVQYISHLWDFFFKWVRKFWSIF